MLLEVNKAEKERKIKSKGRGRKPNLTVADQLLLTLEYLREYRTQFHIGVDYGVDESRVCRISQKIENILIKCKQFHLPGKKEFRKNASQLKMLLERLKYSKRWQKDIAIVEKDTI